jgi:predicted DCC family thiol-disulfide oxidoreductase YuxK
MMQEWWPGSNYVDWLGLDGYAIREARMDEAAIRFMRSLLDGPQLHMRLYRPWLRPLVDEGYVKIGVMVSLTDKGRQYLEALDQQAASDRPG